MFTSHLICNQIPCRHLSGEGLQHLALVHRRDIVRATLYIEEDKAPSRAVHKHWLKLAPSTDSHNFHNIELRAALSSWSLTSVSPALKIQRTNAGMFRTVQRLSSSPNSALTSCADLNNCSHLRRRLAFAKVGWRHLSVCTVGWGVGSMQRWWCPTLPPACIGHLHGEAWSPTCRNTDLQWHVDRCTTHANHLELCSFGLPRPCSLFEHLKRPLIIKLLAQDRASTAPRF